MLQSRNPLRSQQFCTSYWFDQSCQQRSSFHRAVSKRQANVELVCTLYRADNHVTAHLSIGKAKRSQSSTKSMGRVIAIGDVHGCAAALESVLTAIKPRQDDTLVALGDWIDRGPDSKRAVQLLLDWRQKCQIVPLLGNHEEMLLTALARPFTVDDWLACGGEATLRSYGVSDPLHLPEEHVAYIRTWGDYFETPTHFFAHGNYAADIPLDQQTWEFWRWEPLRVSMPGPHQNGKIAVVGHTSQKTGKILDLNYLVCIDTYCHGGGKLTALDVVSGRIWQADAAGRLPDQAGPQPGITPEKSAQPPPQIVEKLESGRYSKD
jgi:serine/threonine protein phosphatase 1